MANTKVTGDVIANGTISTVHIADDAITAAKLDSTATGITFADLAVSGNSTLTGNLTVNGFFTSQGIDDNADATAITINGNEEVGIGTTTPLYKLDVNGTFRASGNATFAGNIGVAGKTPAYGLNLAQGTGAGNKIAWTDGTPNFAASIYANSSTDKLTFATKNASNVETTALEIDISQNSTFAGTVQTTQITATNGLNYLKRNTDASLQLRSENTRSGLFITKPATDTVMGSALVLADESYRFGTANYYHMIMLQNGNTYFNQNVGIGTTSPSQKLETVGIIKSSGVSNSLMFSDRTTAANTWEWYSNGNNAGLYKNHNTASTVMTINSSGNVGIGTTTLESGAKLEVRAGAGGKMVFGSYDANYKVVIEAGDQLNFYNGTSATTAYINYGQSGTPGNILLSRNLLVEANSSGGTSGTVRIKSDGKVGIGTTSPGVKLDIVGSSSGSITNLMRIQNPVNSAGTGHGASLILHSTPDSNRGVAIASSSATNYATNNDMLFYTSSSSALYERMRIDSNGQVGIGTTSPSATFHVQTAGSIKLFNDNTYGYISIGSSGLTGQYPYLRVDSFRSDGSGYFWAFGHETPGGVKSIKMLINDTANDEVTIIRSLAISTFASNEFNSAYPSFSTGALIRSNDTSYFNGGNVGIGITSPLTKLQVNGDIGIGEMNGTRPTNVRFSKNDVNVITFTITVAAIGAWRPGSCWIQVSGTQNGLQEYYSAWYFIRLTHYYASGVAGQGTSNPPCILDSGGDTGSVTVGVIGSNNISTYQEITITLTDVGGTTNSMVADINCTMQVGIESIT